MEEEEGVAYDDSFAEFMTEINDHFSTLVKESTKAPQDAYEEWQAFKAAVNWDEWFLMPLLATYITLFLLVLLTRNNINFQFVIFTSIFVFVLCAQWINRLCAENWQSFATQNYFQDRGTFVAVFLCAPLLAIATVQLINFLIVAASTLVEVKKLEFAAARKQKETKETSGEVEDTPKEKSVSRKKKSKKDN